MVVKTRLYTRGSQAFSQTLIKPPIQVTHQGHNNYTASWHIKVGFAIRKQSRKGAAYNKTS